MSLINIRNKWLRRLLMLLFLPVCVSFSVAGEGVIGAWACLVSWPRIIRNCWRGRTPDPWAKFEGRF